MPLYAVLQEADKVRNVTTSRADRWQHQAQSRPAGLVMNEEQQEIEALIAQAQAGDETAREALLGVIEDMLVEGIGLPTPKAS